MLECYWDKGCHLVDVTWRDMVIAQYDAMTDELNRRREECIQLRTLLASRSSRAGSVAGGDRSNADSGVPLNEDGELEMAYKTQKDLNK